MEHIATIKNRRVVDIEAPTGDLDGHIVVAGGAGVDTLTIKTDKEWIWYPNHFVIFERDGVAYEYEAELIGGKVTVPIPSSLMMQEGKVRFTLKALDAENVIRLVTDERGAYLMVTKSGAIDGSQGHEDELTTLEQALLDIGDLEEVADDAREAAAAAHAAADRCDGIADMDYTVAINKPTINEVTLTNNTLEELGMSTATNRAVIDLF